MFSNHGCLSSSIISGHSPNSVLNPPRGKSIQKSRSPSGLRSPTGGDNLGLYKRHAKEPIARAKTPTMANFEKRASVVKIDRPDRQARNREAIRLKKNLDNAKPQKPEEFSPSEKKSPKRKASPKKSQSPVYSRLPDLKYLKDYSTPLSQNDVSEEKPRTLANYKIGNTQENELKAELEKIKRANLELKDTMEKLMSSHIDEKKRIVQSAEKLTQDYDKYARFYRDNFDRLRKYNEQKSDPSE